MSLKARLRIAILALVTFVVVAMSLLYLYDFTKGAFSDASSRAQLIADQVKGWLLDRLDGQVAARGQRPSSLNDWKQAWTEIVRSDPSVTDMLKRTLADAELVLAIVVTDEQGKVLAASNPALVDKAAPPPEDFRDVERGFWLRNLWDLMTRREDYAMTRPLGVEGHEQVLFKVTVIVRSVLLKHAVEPALNNLSLAFAASLFIAIFLGSVLPNVVLDPLQRVSRSIDLIRTGEFDTATLPARRESREFADVHSKLNLLGAQYRGAKQDAHHLRSNIEQLLQRLEEGVLLFDNTGRLIVAGESAARMLGKSHDEMMGCVLTDLFHPYTVLGGVIEEAIRSKESIQDRPVTVARDGADSNKLLVSVQVLGKSPAGEEIGTLITVRDAESRRQLEHQLDLSSRLAAISRLTGGVAHEIKNPLNAIALHLEVLKSRLDGQQPEIDVIAGEIKRLDTVVKTFLNFNKPIQLQTHPIDLNQLVEQIFALVSRDAEAKHVQLDSKLDARLLINGDPDLLKQAILNVVINGLEAMQDGGSLTARTSSDGDECQLSITDAGPGIPLEIRDRIFNLYFTTKEQGTGIGLATTFRVVQLHSGTIDFVSEPGKGTTFRMRFPGMVGYQGEVLTSATTTS
jgi:signal transduction histidine kinase